MICPNCNKTCADGSTFCPHCEAVLDASILGDLAALEQGGQDEDTPVPDAPAAPPPPRPKPVARPAARPRRRAPIDEGPGDASEPSPEPPARSQAGGGYVNKYSQYWTDEPGTERAPDTDPGVARPSSPAEREGFQSNVSDPSEQLKALWAAFLALGFEDKLTASSAFGLFVMSFMPWRTTPDGDDMGFLTWGFLTLLLSIAAMGSIWARKTGKIAALPAPMVPLAAVGAGGLSALIAVLFALLSFERTSQFGKAEITSRPTFGVFLALICAAGVAVGGWLTYKLERKR